MADEEFFYADGVNASSGYLLERAAPGEMAEAAKQAVASKGELEKHLAQMRADRDASGENFATAAHIDPTDLAQTGWGVIFPSVTPGAEAKKQAAIREALQPLLQHRQRQVNHEQYYREFDGEYACEPEDTNQTFFERLDGHDPGAPADPATGVPYYLLLVGSASEISFSFQYQLDITYAVGRVHFERPDGSPDLDAYHRYAQSVVEAETRPLRLARELALFAVQNPRDKATELSRHQLVQPLGEWFEKARELQGWKLQRYYDDVASKATLNRLLGGDATPALLFTASHGVGFDRGDPRQIRHGGALLCADWQNPRPFVPLTERDYFSCDDVPSDARLHGLIAFNFACYGGGTPDEDEYAHLTPGKPTRIADRPFVAGLPQRLLGHPKGGALATVGHIERAWSDSLPTGKGATNRIGVFSSAMFKLMKGEPVGLAMDYFNQRYAQLGADMSSEIQKLEKGKDEATVRLKKAQFARKWTQHNDARDYVVNGDPAARLRFDDDASDAKPAREALEIKTFVASVTVEVAATAAAASSSSESAAASDPTAFGLIDTVRSMVTGEPSPPETEAAPELELESEPAPPSSGNPLRDFADRVTKTFGDLVSDAASLEVRTFVSNTSSAVAVTEDVFQHAQLRAWTRIKLDGDIDVCVPQVDGQVDTALWALHVEMVKQAQAHRSEMFKMVLATVAGVFKP